MLIKKERNLFHLTLSAYELAALISSARWVTDGTKGELPPEAINHLKQVLANYDKVISKVIEPLQPKTL